MKIYCATTPTWDRYVGKDAWVKCYVDLNSFGMFGMTGEFKIWYVKALSIQDDGVLKYNRISETDIVELVNNSAYFFKDSLHWIRSTLEGRSLPYACAVETMKICTPVELYTTEDLLEMVDNYEAQDQ